MFGFLFKNKKKSAVNLEGLTQELQDETDKINDEMKKAFGKQFDEIKEYATFANRKKHYLHGA